jgi:hypothetical protein
MAQSDIEVTRTVEYEGNVRLALQQTTTKVAHMAQQGSHTGPKAELEDIFGTAAPQTKDTRFGPMKTSDAGQTRRWLAKPRQRYYRRLIDNDDQLSTKIDIKGPYTMQGAATLKRIRDEAWLLGYYGTALTGEDGSTGVAFKSANIVGVSEGSGGTGLSIEKIMAGLELLRGYHVDLEMEKPVLLVTAKQITNLLKQLEVTSKDYNKADGEALQKGIVREFLGCIMVPMEYGNATSFPLAASLTVDGSGYRRVPMFVPSGMHIGVWQELQADISQMKDLEGLPWQIFAGTIVGGTRMDEDKCLQLLCAEPGTLS